MSDVVDQVIRQTPEEAFAPPPPARKPGRRGRVGKVSWWVYVLLIIAILGIFFQLYLFFLMY
jgi:hypothetical protein